MGLEWPLEFPGAHWVDEAECEAVLDVVRNGSMFRYYGIKAPSHVEAYEAGCRDYYDCSYALGLNSGTGALVTAMAALDIGPGCEVIVPALMWVATVAAVVHVNAIPRLCEVDDSFTMDPADLEAKITKRTKLIVPVHMAGCPCNMDAIMAVARNHDIPVLEDCAQCNGGSFRGTKVGTFGNIGIFSLQLNKNMTSGEGGLLITDDERLYARAFSAHDMGLVRKGGRLVPPEPYAITWGAGRRMTELCGAVAEVQLSKLPQIVGSMRASKYRIKAALEGTPGLAFRRVHDDAGDTGPFLIVILEDADRARKAAAKMVGAGLHSVFRIADYGLHIYYNIPSLVKKVSLSPAGNPWNLAENRESVYDYGKGTCPKSDDLFERSVLIPVPSKLTVKQEEAAVAIIRDSIC